MKCALIGYGYWGKILKQYIDEDASFELVEVCTHRDDKEQLQRILESKNIEAVFIATPIDTHFYLCRRFLDSGKHVFCEKPLCKNPEDVRTLASSAAINRRILFTDYIYIESPSINLAKSKLPSIGQLTNIDAKITQWGNFYKDDGVVDVLGVHIFSVLYYLNPSFRIENIATADIEKDDNGNLLKVKIIINADNTPINVEVSLINKTKERNFAFRGSKGEIIVDMLSEKNVVLNYADGKVEEYSFDEKNNIKAVLTHFWRCMESNMDNLLLAEQVAVLAKQVNESTK